MKTFLAAASAFLVSIFLALGVTAYAGTQKRVKPQLTRSNAQSGGIAFYTQTVPVVLALRDEEGRCLVETINSTYNLDIKVAAEKVEVDPAICDWIEMAAEAK